MPHTRRPAHLRPAAPRAFATASALACCVVLASACTPTPQPGVATVDGEAAPAPSFSRASVEPVEPAPPIASSFSAGGPLLVGANDLTGPTSTSTSLTMDSPALQGGQYTLTFACSSPDKTAVVTALVQDPQLNVVAVQEGECAVHPESSEHAVDFILDAEGVNIMLDSASPGLALAGRVDLSVK